MDYSNEQNEKNRKENNSKKKKVKNKVGVIIFRVFIAGFLISVFALGGALVGAYFGIVENAPKLEPLKIQPNIYTSIIYDENGNEIDRLKAEENREYVSKEDIPLHLKNAFVAIEDERFYSHDGIDLKGMARALYINFTSDRKEGASTITQQIIKNNVLKVTRNTLDTKLKEQYLALEYEKALVKQYNGSKEQAKAHILEVYLNTISLHHGLNGVQTASNYYFNKDVSQLTLSESSVIAGITQNPAKYSPINHPENNKVRRKMVLDKMLELEMISQSEYNEAINDNVYERVNTKEKVIQEQNSYHSYFNDALIKQVVEDLEKAKNFSTAEAYYYLYNAGLQIYSTQNLEMQQMVDESFMDDTKFSTRDYEIEVQYTLSVKNTITDKIEHYFRKKVVKNKDQIEPFKESVKNELLGANDVIIDEKDIPIPQPQAAMIIIDYHTGQVKAVTGGRGEKLANLALNRATDSTRQPGSVFKVLASYAPAIDLGRITPSTIIVDEPFEYKGYKPKNWYGGFKGPSTVRDGIRMSMNVITVKNMINTGIDECFQYLLNFGFTTLADNDDIGGKIYTDRTPAACLGGLTYGVTQIEVAAAYGTIANGGEYNKPVFYTKVIDHEGNLVLENTIEPKQVLKSQSAYILTDMMKDVITSGTGTKARLKQTKIPVAGKTGTTTDTKDLTFVGYTPYYVGSIWMGFDSPKPLEDRGYHLTLWADVMDKIHKDLPYKDFEKFTGTEGVVNASVCTVSGKLAVVGLCSNDPRGDMTKTDVFMSGTQSKEYCNVHVKVTVDTSTNMKAGPYCPPEYLKTIVGITPGYYSDEASKKYEIQNIWASGDCTYHRAPPSSGENSNGPGIGDSESTPPPPDFGNQGTEAPVIPNTETPIITNQPIMPTPSVPTQAPLPTPTATPVPVYTQPPQNNATEPPQPPPSENIPLPDLPTMDDPQSVDTFSY